MFSSQSDQLHLDTKINSKTLWHRIFSKLYQILKNGGSQLWNRNNLISDTRRN